MTSPILALRAAIHDGLVADPVLTRLLGGAYVYDETPAGAVPPYVTFGEATANDWSSGDAHGHEHDLFLNVWSRQGGDAEALGLAGQIAGLLDGAALILEGHRLIRLRIAAQDVGRPTKDGLRRASVRVAALTETA